MTLTTVGFCLLQLVLVFVWCRLFIATRHIWVGRLFVLAAICSVTSFVLLGVTER